MSEKIDNNIKNKEKVTKSQETDQVAAEKQSIQDKQGTQEAKVSSTQDDVQTFVGTAEKTDKGIDKSTETVDEAEEMIPKKQYEDLLTKYEAMNDRYLRLNAEFDNYKKRTLKEKSELIRNGGERVLTGLVALLDDVERAMSSLKNGGDINAVGNGLELIYSKFITFLNQNGVKEIKAIGEKFDADKFEAVTMYSVDDKSKEGIVIDCVQKGYTLNDKIIRFPKVVVGE